MPTPIAHPDFNNFRAARVHVETSEKLRSAMRIVRAVLIAWFVVIFVPRAFGQAKIAAQPVRAVRFGKLWDGHGKVWAGAIVIVEDGKIRNVTTAAPAFPLGAEGVTPL